MSQSSDVGGCVGLSRPRADYISYRTFASAAGQLPAEDYGNYNLGAYMVVLAFELVAASLVRDLDDSDSKQQAGCAVINNLC